MSHFGYLLSSKLKPSISTILPFIECLFRVSTALTCLVCVEFSSKPVMLEASGPWFGGGGAGEERGVGIGETQGHPRRDS